MSGTLAMIHSQGDGEGPVSCVLIFQGSRQKLLFNGHLNFQFIDKNIFNESRNIIIIRKIYENIQ